MKPEVSVNPALHPVIDINSTILERLTPDVVDYPPNRGLAIQIEKRAIYQDILALSEGMNDAEKALLKEATDIAFLCHRDHFRLGENAAHYSRHLLEVASRFKNNFKPTGESFNSADGDEISDLAVGIAASVLHDSKEDIFKTFKALTDRKQSDAIVESHIREKLLLNLDTESLDRLCGLITKLSIQNSVDISDSFYVRAIETDKIASQIKLADISHNMELMHEVSVLSGAVVFPAQYAEFLKGSYYENQFLSSVCKSLGVVDFSKIDLSRPPQNSDERVAERLLSVEGETAAIRVVKFYENLLQKLESEGGQSLIPAGIKSEELVSNIKKGLEIFSAIGQYNQPTSKFPERDIEVEGISIGLLGPVAAWTAEIRSECTLEVLQNAVTEASKLSNQRISGFIVHNTDGSLSYHMSRWARRSGLEVPAASEYENSARKITEVLSESYSVLSDLSISAHSGDYTYSTLLGLEEGYFEGRKKNLLVKTGINSGAELLKAFTEEVGDPDVLGIDTSKFDNLETAKEYLQGISLGIVHTVAEVRAGISNEAIEITPANIYSVDPVSQYIYEEPAVLLRGAKDSNFISNVSYVANAFHQARISVQYDAVVPEAYNFEFKEDTNNSAARMR